MRKLTTHSPAMVFGGTLALTMILWSDCAVACPFCAAESRTLTEEIGDSSAVLLAKLAAPSAVAQDPAEAGVPYAFVDPETGGAKFTIERILLGENLLKGVEQVEAIYFGDPDTQTVFYLRGVGEPPEWTIPMPLSERAVEYVTQLFSLPPSGVERVAFFQEYLEDEDPLLGQDAYDEFARAPYQDIIDLADRMDRDQLIAWIEGSRVSPSRRRLFLTMLGVCGQQEDLRRIEALLRSDIRLIGPVADAAAAASLATAGGVSGLSAAVVPEAIRFGERGRKLGLDAMIACYLTLSGRLSNVEAALVQVEDRFLRDPQTEYSHVHAALMAVRFLAEERQDLVPLERVIRSARLLLDNPEFADQVIPDLARWEDWSVIDRMVQLFEKSFEEDANRYVREPVITYLDVAAEQPGAVGEAAVRALERVEGLDPAAAKRARSLQAFGFLAQARSPSPSTSTATEDPPDPAEIPSPENLALEPALEASPAAPSKPERSPAELAALQAEANARLVAAEKERRSGFANSLRAEAAARDTAQDPPTGLLVGLPLLGAAVCMSVFWVILRGGAA
ncbi:hypothetical protein [Botrimarina hoheduenensis]|uniref:Uncharacterized protein n=1 Tax=Botrimarina hoheduenensis TaxID=2528000 RepID=A0A5C5WBM7_9BACT|nr:hypothetical protein [Botrimarina hoheduenensis]TWT47451.1 hypothetical protein Pla111_10650 [Botrimarina hoheduenensis]